jgi:hypothetical protein
MLRFLDQPFFSRCFKMLSFTTLSISLQLTDVSDTGR